jgi:glycosyltransferase involved in cell wall biosynthesis
LQVFIKVAKILDKLILNNADAILVGGIAHNAYLKALNPKVVIKTVSPSMHPLSKITKNKKEYVLMVTAWKKGKNPEYIFELIKLLPKLRIQMVGKWLDDLYKKEFLAQIAKKKLSENILIIGEVDEKSLAKHYSEALLLLQTNDDRGFGMPALEAAGHGTTFIIPKGQGVCALFKDKIDGFYTKEMDTSSIVTCLNELLKNKNMAVSMGRHAWETVRKNNSWKNHAALLIELVNEYGK